MLESDDLDIMIGVCARGQEERQKARNWTFRLLRR